MALQADQRRVLIVVLVINAVMFLVEFSAGLVGRSSALQADAVDMLGDAVVYELSLFAIGRGPRWEAGAAVAKGVLILVFFLTVVGSSLQPRSRKQAHATVYADVLLGALAGGPREVP